MIRRLKGSFDDPIVMAEHGADIVPEHNPLVDIGDWLSREQE